MQYVSWFKPSEGCYTFKQPCAIAAGYQPFAGGRTINEKYLNYFSQFPCL